MAKEIKLRSLDATNTDLWTGGKGPSKDGGIGNKCVTALRDAGISDDEIFSKVETVYKKVVAAVKGLTKNEQKSACLCGASDFTLDSLRGKATTSKAAVKSLDDLAWEKVNKMKGAPGWSMGRVMTEFANAKETIKAERRAKADK